MKMIARKEITSSLVLIALGVGYLAYNSGYSMDTWANPGPAVFPLIVGGLFIFMILCDIVQASHKARDHEQEKRESNKAPARPGWIGTGEAKAVSLLVIFALYIFMIQGAGFFVSNIVFVVVCSRVMGAKDWVRPIALAAGISLCCYLLFEVWLKLSLPRGFLF